MASHLHQLLNTLVFCIVLLAPAAMSLKGCGGACSNNDDCQGQLACLSGKCRDDPDVGTHICSGAGSSPPSSSGGSCKASSYLVGTGHSCNTQNDAECCVSGKRYQQYHCSPPVTGKIAAVLTLNSFQRGGDGGAESECDNDYHDDSELVVALSTGWYNSGSRCQRKIRITDSNGRSVLAKVVDECDSVNGCDAEHSYQPPCRFNVVDASPAVWEALGIPSSDPRYGQMNVFWADA